MKLALSHKNAYTWPGLSLLIAGIILSSSAYFILNLIWLTALGICMLILSFILLTLGRTVPRLSPEVCSLLLETGVDNIASIAEEIGLRSKALYLPASLTSDQPQALVPLHSNSSLPTIDKTLPRRFIVRYGNQPDDVGLLISTIGSTAITMLESKPGPSTAELESALNYLFTGCLGIADGTMVSHLDNTIKVEISRPRLDNHANWSHHCLGGPLASVVATVAAEAWNKPVTITHEETRNGKCYIELEVTG